MSKVYTKLTTLVKQVVTSSLEDEKEVERVMEGWRKRKNDALKALGLKTKDENAPKRAKTAYIFFCQERRAKLVKKHPDKKTTEITKMLSEEWEKTKKAKKTKKYEKMAESDRERYQSEKESYSSSLPQKVKRPSSAYIHFCNANRDKIRKANPDLTPKELLKKCGEEWKKLSDKQKEPYKKRQREDKERYESQKSEVSVAQPATE